jgi:hypothetical protein
VCQWAPFAVDRHAAGAFLELADSLRHGGLREFKPFGRSRHARKLRDGKKDLERLEIEHGGCVAVAGGDAC